MHTPDNGLVRLKHLGFSVTHSLLKTYSDGNLHLIYKNSYFSATFVFLKLDFIDAVYFYLFLIQIAMGFMLESTYLCKILLYKGFNN
jgi:hypothetical protein